MVVKRPIFDSDIALPCSSKDIASRLAALQPVQERQRIRRLWREDIARRRKPMRIEEWFAKYGARKRA